MTVSPNHPSTPHHQPIADIDNSTIEIILNWRLEPFLDLQFSVVIVAFGPLLPFWAQFISAAQCEKQTFAKDSDLSSWTAAERTKLP